MKVRQLIAQLKKMPQYLDVGVSAHDNPEHEVSGWICGVDLFDKDEIECPDHVGKYGRQCYEGLPHRVVVIRC